MNLTFENFEGYEEEEEFEDDLSVDSIDDSCFYDTREFSDGEAPVDVEVNSATANLETICNEKWLTIDELTSYIKVYAFGQGFSIVKNRRKIENNVVVYQEYFCSRFKTKNDRSKNSAACGCKFHLNFKLEKNEGKAFYKCCYTVTEHNHDLLSPNEIIFLHKYRQLPKEIILFIQDLGRNISSITLETVEQLVRMNFKDLTEKENFLWIPNDVKNILAKIRKEKKVYNHALHLIEYLQQKSNSEAFFFFRFKNEGNLLISRFYINSYSFEL